MVWALLLGGLSFGLMIAYDCLNAYRQRHVPALFFLGAGLLILATGWLLWLGNPAAALAAHPVRFCFGAVGAGLCTGGMIHTLFFALPFGDTYAQAGTKECVSRGWYALCRHPSALLCYGSYGFLVMMTPSLSMLLGLLVFPTLNLAYVAWEDRLIFPRAIAGYDRYQEETPFLIPTPSSIRRMRDSGSR